MNIVISGYYGFENIGDEAILYSIVQALRSYEPDVQITVLSNDPEHTKKTYNVDAINRWKYNGIITAIKNADGVISGGGSLFQDQTGMKSIPYYASIIKIAKWFRKPVFVYAQGMGPFNKGFSKWLMRNTMKKVDVLTVRDERSKKLLQDIGVKRSITVVPDPVMGIELKNAESDWIKGRKLENSFITVSVRDWPSAFEYKVKIARTLEQCIDAGYEVVFIPMHGKHDDIASQEIASLMNGSPSVHYAPYDASIEEKIAIIGQSEVLLGMRLHSLIFGAITNTPFVGITYDPKVDALMELCNQPLAGHVNEDDWDTERLTHLVLTHLQNVKIEKVKLELKVKEMRASAKDTAKKAIELFKNPSAF